MSKLKRLAWIDENPCSSEPPFLNDLLKSKAVMNLSRGVRNIMQVHFNSRSKSRQRATRVNTIEGLVKHWQLNLKTIIQSIL